MTTHASQHANNITLAKKSNTITNSGAIRNAAWPPAHQHPAIQPKSAESTSSYCTIGVPGPTLHRQSSVNSVKHYQIEYPKHASTLPRQKRLRNYTSYQDRPPLPAAQSTVSGTGRTSDFTHPPKHYDDYTSVVHTFCTTSRVSSDRPTTPINLSSDGIVYPCGGHCRTLERCCHYILRFAFVIGILTGVSMVLAAYWQNNDQRQGNDGLLLVYIGVLIALVCTLLLSIQCSVEKEVKRKKRNRRTATLLARSNNRFEVPMQDLSSNARFGYMMAVPTDERTVPTSSRAFSEMPLMYNPYYEGRAKSYDEMSQSQNGIPWWRRCETQVTFNKDNIV